MATIKPTIRKNRPNKHGLVPVYIQITHNRQTTEYSLRVYIDPKHWDDTKPHKPIKRAHERATLLNARINGITRAIQSLSDKLDIDQEFYTAKSLLDRYRGKNSSKTILLDYIEDFIKTNPENLGLGTLKNYSKLVTDLKEFKPTLRITRMTPEFIQEYDQYLRSKELSDNTVHERMKNLKKITNKLIKEEELTKSPFTHYKVKRGKSKKEFLTPEELKAFEGYNSDNYSDQLIKDVFIFACHTGLRFSDLCTLKSDNIQEIGLDKGYRLYITMRKTEEVLSIKLSDKALTIADKWRDEYVFPILDTRYDLSQEAILRKQIGSKNAYFNKRLKGIIAKLDIHKTISMHCARHTFATISLQLGTSIEVVSKLMGHKSLSETQVYAKILDNQKDAGIDAFNAL